MLQILQGNCLAVLPTLPAASIQCCVTSPPYWGLRDYGTAQWEGGQVGCDHIVGTKDERLMIGGGCASWTTRDVTVKKGGDCPKCGAHRIDDQLGLEETPEAYLANMVAVFREVWRVLRDDGTLWLNLGDSYNYQENRSKSVQTEGRKGYDGNFARCVDRNNGQYGLAQKALVSGLKPKNLVGIPWRVAFALQADGWYLRSDIIWHKPNPMPESVTDRPTKSHEYIFLFSKRERYFYDAEAIREENSETSHTGGTYREAWKNESIGMGGRTSQMRIGVPIPCNGRNKRTVWTIATQSYAEAHFATFPEELPKLCILAGSKPGDTVLDPFAGSGTTGKVAIELGRKAVLIELNPDYVNLAQNRCNVTPGWY